jgi:Tfp pilus assembly protein PilO
MANKKRTSSDEPKKSILLSSNYQVPKKARSWGVGILVGIVVVILPAKYIVLPIRDHYVTQEKQIQAQDAIVQAKVQEGEAVNSRPSYYSNEKSLLSSALPLVYKQEQIIKDVSNIAIQDNIQMTSLSVDPGTTSGVAVGVPQGEVSHPVAILGDGLYSDIKRFIHDIQAQPQLYQIDKVQISQFTNSTSGSNSYSSGTDVIDISALAFTSN